MKLYQKRNGEILLLQICSSQPISKMWMNYILKRK